MGLSVGCTAEGAKAAYDYFMGCNGVPEVLQVVEQLAPSRCLEVIVNHLKDKTTIVANGIFFPVAVGAVITGSVFIFKGIANLTNFVKEKTTARAKELQALTISQLALGTIATTAGVAALTSALV